MLSANKVDQLIIRAEWWLQTEDLKSQIYESFGKGITGEEDGYVIDPYDRIQIKELDIQEDLEEPYIWLRLQAITCYQKALQIDPKHIFALTRLGLLYLSIADEINGEVKKQYLDKALTNVKRACDLSPANPTINFVLGYIFGFYDIDQEKSRKHYHACHEVSPCFFITIEQDTDKILNYKINDQERVSVFLNCYQLKEFYRYAINDFPDPSLMWIDLMEFSELCGGSLHLPEQYREALIQVPEDKRHTLGCKILQLRYFHSLASGEHSNRNLALEVYKEFFDGQGFEWLKDLEGWWLANIEGFLTDALLEEFLLENDLIDESKRVYRESCRNLNNSIYLWENQIRLLKTLGTANEIIKTCEEGLVFQPQNVFFYKEIIGAYTSLNDLKGLNRILEDGRKLFSTDSSFMGEYWYYKFIIQASREESYWVAESEIEKSFDPDTWRILNSESKRDLTTAHHFYRTYASDSDTLFSAASIAHGYCRAWEREIEKHIIEPILWEIDRKRRQKNWRKSETIEVGEAKIKRGGITPVQIAWIISEAQKAKNTEPYGDAVNRCINKYNNAIKTEFPTLANEIALFRNAADHPAPFSKRQLDDLISLVIGQNKDGGITKILKWVEKRN